MSDHKKHSNDESKEFDFTLGPINEGKIVRSDRLGFVVLPMSKLDKARRERMGITIAQAKNLQAFGYMVEVDERDESAVFRCYIGDGMAGDLRKLVHQHSRTFDRIARMFLVNVLVLECLQDGSDLRAESICNVARDLLTELGEAELMSRMVTTYLDENNISVGQLPLKIQEFMGLAVPPIDKPSP